MLAITYMPSLLRATAVRVVLMPANCGRAEAMNPIDSLPQAIAFSSAASSGMSSRLLSSSASESTIRCEATSPAAAPPTPSATAATRGLVKTASSLLARRPMSLRAAHSKARPDILRIVTPRGCACQRLSDGSSSSARAAPAFPQPSGCATLAIMNVLALYDIHANVDALEAVLRDAPEPDLVLVGGDAVPGAFAVATLDRLAQLETRWVRGNGEREVAAAVDGPDPATDDPAGVTAKLSSDELGPERSRPLGELPLTLEIDGVLYCHATPRSDEEILTRLSTPERYADALSGVTAGVV